MHVVASSNAQAKQISTKHVKARTIHNACCMRVQKYKNPRMRPGTKRKSLTRMWDKCMVLVIDEISMVSAPLYNMLDFRSMYGRSKTHEVHEHSYVQSGNAFGKSPIVIHLGDFLQLKPIANISLIDDLNAENDDGEYLHQDVSVEAKHARCLLTSIPFVIELHGAKRFVTGDSLVEFLACMRAGATIPGIVWNACEATFAEDDFGQLDSRHTDTKFLNGYGMSMYWETLSRWIPRRASRDAKAMKVPLVFCQAADECRPMDRDAASRFLNVFNIHHTGHMHGVFPAHFGMRVRLTQKINATLGLVQKQIATIVDIVMHPSDDGSYRSASPGTIFRPKFVPAGYWLIVEDFSFCPIWEELLPLVSSSFSEDAFDIAPNMQIYRRMEDVRLAKSMFSLPAIKTECNFKSKQKHLVKRIGFTLTHSFYLTATASQGQTLRTCVKIDCGRIDGANGMSDDNWWLNLYVMFSRVTKMSDLLLLRPPPREILGRGPPENVKKHLEIFEKRMAAPTQRIEATARRFGFDILA